MTVLLGFSMVGLGGRFITLCPLMRIDALTAVPFLLGLTLECILLLDIDQYLCCGIAVPGNTYKTNLLLTVLNKVIINTE